MSKHKSLLSASLSAALFLLCVVAACSGGTSNTISNNAPVGPEPKAAPLFWDDQADLNWIYRNPFKTTMRTMWVDCAKIVSMGRGDKEPDYILIEAYAKDISRRAERMAIRWDAFATTGAALTEAVNDKDWPLANAENETFSKGCDDCHTETWPPIYQHVTKDVIVTWLKNEIPEHTPMGLGEGEAAPATRNRIVMQELLVHLDETEKAVTAKNADAARTHVKAIMDVAADGAKRWHWLKDYADALTKVAADRERQKLGSTYRDMASQCHQCHAQYAEFVDPKTPPRKIHNPMSWD